MIANQSPGQQIASARAALGLGVDEMSSRSFIRASVLRRMEENDFEGCHGEFYARGHLRVLAAVLQMDEASLLGAFDRETPDADATRAGDPPTREGEEPGPHSVGPVLWLGLSLLAMLGLLVAAGALR